MHGQAALILLADPATVHLDENRAAGTDLQDRVAEPDRVLAFTAAVTALTAILFGTVPAIATSATNVQGTLRAGGRG